MNNGKKAGRGKARVAVAVQRHPVCVVLQHVSELVRWRSGYRDCPNVCGALLVQVPAVPSHLGETRAGNHHARSQPLPLATQRNLPVTPNPSVPGMRTCLVVLGHEGLQPPRVSYHVYGGQLLRAVHQLKLLPYELLRRNARLGGGQAGGLQLSKGIGRANLAPVQAS